MMHFIVILWGFTGILGVYIKLSPDVLVWYRMIIASLSLMVALYLFKLPSKLSATKEYWKVIVVGLIVSTHWITFFLSISMSTASLATLCLSTTSFHVSWLEPLILKKKFSILEMGLGIAVVVGIYFIGETIQTDAWPAVYVGLSSAFCAALFSVLNAKLSEKNPTSAISLIEMCTGALILGVVVFSMGHMNIESLRITTNDFILLLFLGVICTSFAFLVMMMIVNKIGVFTASLTINLEPVYTLLMAIPLLEENKQLPTSFYIGAILIVFIVMLNGIIKSKMARKLKTV
jgi:drug/metabolite transporter (DMT)-like permease